MSRAPGDHDPTGLPPAPTGPRRSASATLRTAGPADSGLASLDPAQRSLAEALRISFLLLQVGMLALIVLFLLSGARQVKESERGIRLTFGKVEEQDVPPGLHFSWPYPIGEFLTVQTGLVSVDIDTTFWPRLAESQKTQSLDSLSTLTSMGLKPGEDGAVITGDNNLVHTQWRVEYHRVSPADYIRSVHPPDEERLVRAAVERGVVRAIAEMPIDAVLRQSGASIGAPAAPVAADAAAGASGTPGTPAAPAAAVHAPIAGVESTLAARVRRVAQDTLDAAGSGIRIDQAILKALSPPLPVRPSFAQVQSAQSNAEKARDDAEKERRQKLNSVAGLAHEAILSRIDAYESAIEASDDKRASAVMEDIHALLEGEPVQVDGVQISRLVSGEVTDIINNAKQYRTEIVSGTKSGAETFRAKLEQYRASPAVLVNREWTDAFLDMLSRPDVQVMLLPPDASLELWLNSDPDFLKEQERLRNKEQIREAIQHRAKDYDRARSQMNRDNSNPQPRQ